MELEHAIHGRKLARVEREHGLRRLVDATISRRHLIELAASTDVDRKMIADQVGCSVATLGRIANGQTTSVKRSTEERILQISGNGVSTLVTAIDPRATTLRYQALIAMGYPQRFFGVTPTEAIGPRRALGLIGICVRVHGTPGPSRKAAVQAHTKGWRAPADFDERLFLSPTWNGTEPVHSARERLVMGYLAEYDFRSWFRGQSMCDIVAHLGITEWYMTRLLAHRRQGWYPCELALESMDMVAAG